MSNPEPIDPNAPRLFAVPPPLAAHDDPPNSHIAAAIVAPVAGTRRERVLAVLTAAGGGWVTGAALCAPDVGGSEGLRRVRELRSAGVNVETRPARSGTGWDYRLEPDDPRDDGSGDHRQGWGPT